MDTSGSMIRLLGALVCMAAAACTGDAKDACRTQADCLEGYHCHSDGRCRTTKPSETDASASSSTSSGGASSHVPMASSSGPGESSSGPGESSSSAVVSSSSSGTQCGAGFASCGGTCVSCPAGASAVQCDGARCIATACVGASTPADGACRRLQNIEAAGTITGIVDERLTAEVFPGGRIAVSYVRGGAMQRTVRVAWSDADDVSPFQEENVVCAYGTEGLPCRSPTLISCAGTPTVVYQESHSEAPFEVVRVAAARTGTFTSTSILEDDMRSIPADAACGATGPTHLLLNAAGVLRHRTWDGALLSEATQVATNVTHAALAVDAAGRPLVATVDGTGVLQFHVHDTGGWTTSQVTTGTSGPPGLLVDPTGAVHLCALKSTEAGPALWHADGQPSAWSETIVDQFTTSQPGARCRLARRADGELLISHVDETRARLRLSRRSPAGVWGTDDVDPTTAVLGPQDVVVDGDGVVNVLYVTQQGGLRRAF